MYNHSPACTLCTLWLDFLLEDLEWLDASEVFSPPPEASTFSMFKLLVGVVTATEGWLDADVDPLVSQK